MIPAVLSAARDATEDECADGRAALDSGVDTNLNGQLDADEITATEVFCGGEAGEPGQPGDDVGDTLVLTTDEPAGDNCEVGGVRVDVGDDADGDGSLAESEIEQTTYVCSQLDGEDGLSFLVQTVAATPQDCDGGGIIIESGLDDDGDGTLAGGEVDSTLTFCAGEEGQNRTVEINPELPGPNCSGGGQQVLVGIDTSGDGTLQAAEIESTTFLCDPVSSLVVTTAVPAGATCAAGGVQVDRGLDANANGTLEPTEVIATSNICIGADGLTGLVNTTVEPPGPNCVAGGTRIDSGADVSGNGILETTEIVNTTYACDASPGADGRGNSAVAITPEPSGANCAGGGTRIDTGPDTNGDGVLDPGEVTNTTYACNGALGQRNLVEIEEERPGPNCVSGGRRLDFGIDDNGDEILQPGEIDETSYVCSAVAVVPVDILPDGPLIGFVDQGLSGVSITGIGGIAGGYQWSLANAPPFLGIEATGTPSADLTGTPTMAGTFTFDVVLTDPSGATATRSFTLDVFPVTCGPSSGPNANNGVATPFTVPSPTFPSTVTGVAADSEANGWVYWVDDASSINRFRKDGSAHETGIHVGLGIPTGNIGLEIDSIGSAVYVTNDSTSCTSDCVYRITNDGGVTLTYQDMVSFASAPNNDLRGVHVAGTTMYLITQDTVETQLYTAEIGGALPAPATLVATFPDLESCTGLDGDNQFLYTMCNDVNGSSDGFARISLTGFVAEVIIEAPPDFLIDPSASVGQQLFGQDVTGNGTYDILFASVDSGGDLFVCDPARPTGPYFASEWLDGFSDDEGMGYDRANNIIYKVDESSSTAARFQ